MLREDSRTATEVRAGMPARAWSWAVITGKLAANRAVTHPMTDPKSTPAPAAITPAGLMFLAITAVGWGFNWPVTKYLLGELPPLTMRGTTGVIGAGLLAALALLSGQSLHVPRPQWPRLVLAAMLNVALWMALMGLALLWLPASEAALIAYTMPIWASMLAWPVLGERPNLLRVISLVMAFAGLASIMGTRSSARIAGREGPCRNTSRLRRASLVRIASAWTINAVRLGGCLVGMNSARITPASVA